MNKKGMVFWVMIGLVIGSIAVFFFMYYAIEKVDLGLFLKTKIARDLAIETNTLYAVPGNVELQYPENVSKYIIEFDKEVVRVYQNKVIIPSYYYFRFDEDDVDYEKIVGIDFVNFIKKDNKISFKED